MLEKNTGFEISTKNYIKAAKTLVDLAKNITGIPVPDNTVANWEQIMYSIRIGDDRLDSISNPDNRAEFIKIVMVYLKSDSGKLDYDPVLNKSISDLKNMCSTLSPRNRTLLLNTFDRLLKVTEELKNVDSINRFAFLTRLEGQITSKLFLLSLPENYCNSGNRKKLFKVFTRFGRFADILDTFIDLPDDKDEGLTVINPTVKNRLILLKSSIPDAAIVIKNFKPNFNLAFQFGQRTLETVENNPRK